MTNSLIINFSQETVLELNKGNYSLCCFLACKSKNASSFRPLCWSVTKGFLRSVLIEWEYKLSAYVSTSEIAENKVIYIPQPDLSQFTSKSRSKTISGSNYKIALKQRMLIKDYGEIVLDTNNEAETILIQNDSATEYATGICVCNNNDSKYYGNGAFRIFGKNNIEVTPDNKAFLMFSDTNPQNNTVMLTSQNPGILIDFTISDNVRTVTFDVNTGWSSSEQGWSTQYPKGTDLKALLVS